MKEIVINNQYGGFNLSPLAIKEFLKLKGKECYFYETKYEHDKNGKTIIKYEKQDINNLKSDLFIIVFTKDFGGTVTATDISDEDYKEHSFCSNEIDREDKDLVKIVKQMGTKANTRVSTLKIVEIPNNVDYEIEEYDGNEWVAEKHRRWS